MQPPIVPKVKDAGDSTNFETYPEEDWQTSQDLPETVLQKFDEFWGLGIETSAASSGQRRLKCGKLDQRKD